MVDSTAPTPGWMRPAAPDRHPPKGPVAPPLCPFAVRRPASTVRTHPAAQTAESTIESRRDASLVDLEVADFHAVDRDHGDALEVAPVQDVVGLDVDELEAE